MYWRFIKNDSGNFWIFFSDFFKKTALFRRLWAPNRHNRVDIKSVGSHNRRKISFKVLFWLVFYVSGLFINRCCIFTYNVSYITDVKRLRLSTAPASTSVSEPT